MHDQDSEGIENHFKIKDTTPMEKLFKDFAKRYEKEDSSKWMFVHDGECILDTDTCNSLG